MTNQYFYADLFMWVINICCILGIILSITFIIICNNCFRKIIKGCDKIIESCDRIKGKLK